MMNERKTVSIDVGGEGVEGGWEGWGGGVGGVGGKLCICNYKSECVFTDSCCVFVYVVKVTYWYRRMHRGGDKDR